MVPYSLVVLWRKARCTGADLLPGLPWPEAQPQLQELPPLVQQVREACHRQQVQVRSERLQAWKVRVQDQWPAEPGQVFAWVAGGRSAPTTLLQREDGGVTANVEEMDAILQAAWAPIFRKYASQPEPPWEPFLAEYERVIPPASPMVSAPFTADVLQRRLTRTSKRRAAGLDGWRTAELKSMPLPLLELLAQLLNVVEETGIWPDAIPRTEVVLIPKGEGTGPLQQRPLSIASVVYRLWAGVRLEDAMQWQESWVLSGQSGFRLKHCTEDLYWELALRVEDVRLALRPAYWGGDAGLFQVL